MANNDNNEEGKRKPLNFIEQIVEEDLKNNKNGGRVHTRFPPEPNGFLHIGHAKSICLNFGIAEDYHGKTNLRFDDTNPLKEEQKYIDSIKEDVHWLGFDWEEREFYASDYFERLYEFAVKLIRQGNAYVCELTPEEVKNTRGTPTEPGQESPYRDRPIEENLDLFQRMRAGEFEDGRFQLRAKIDMASPNMQMRDPILYRIRHIAHPRTGNEWCIYPMYDFAHGQSDYIEGITHSLCTMEFENHRPLYDWFLDKIAEGDYRPRQIEFARLNLSYTVMSKRKLLELVNEGFVDAWDDPRMPTISGLRRRGYTPHSIREFSEKVGIAKRDNVIDVALLENSLREDLNKRAQRVMTVLDPIKVVITNYSEDKEEELDAVNNPEDESMGTRKVPFSRELYIERADFMEEPPKKFFRLAPGREVRLRYAYYITCEGVVKNEFGEITEIRCSYDPQTKGGQSPDGRKVKGTLHWVSAQHALPVEVRQYDRLFMDESPDKVKEEGKDFKSNLNPDSLHVLENCMAEPFLKDAQPEDTFQFERKGYFCVDRYWKPGEKMVFNRAVTLKDTWAKIAKQQQQQGQKNKKK
ncbi:MAG TPA: glutamine--tRNA ligase/YqeY domain fusion protein [Bacteroidales bacterium]|nr:glutamine--tRNA ligase/YqeY domain fusion protein [Bacteroidales bacterium]